MKFENISGVIKTANSDTDLQLWVPNNTFSMLTKALSSFYSSGQIRIAWLNKVLKIDVELFIVDEDNPTPYAIAASESRRIQVSWSIEEREKYARAKEAIKHLSGHERKIAKAKLAMRFGLPTVQYLRGFSSEEINAHNLVVRAYGSI